MTAPATLCVPNYNGGRFLERTLRSLLAQRYDDFRVMLLDNRSTDDSVSIAQSIDDPRLEIVVAGTHVPHVQNFNRAVERVRTPLFALCASDEAYEPDWLPTLAGLLQRDPQAFAAICRPDTIDEDDRVYLADQERYKDSFWPVEDPVFFDPREQALSLVRGNYLIITTCLFRTDAFRDIGPIEDTLPFTGDWAYWYRGIFAGYRIVGTRRRLAHYRRHGGQLTHQLNRSLRRFEEEAYLCDWIAAELSQRGWRDTTDPDYDVVVRTILREFASLLRRGDRTGASALARFAQERLPSERTLSLMRPALRLGRPAGLVLEGGATLWLHGLRLKESVQARIG